MAGADAYEHDASEQKKMNCGQCPSGSALKILSSTGNCQPFEKGQKNK